MSHLDQVVRLEKRVTSIRRRQQVVYWVFLGLSSLVAVAFVALGNWLAPAWVGIACVWATAAHLRRLR